MMRRRWIMLAAVVLTPVLALYGCVSVVLPAVSNDVRGDGARPAVLGAFGADPAIETAADWEAHRAPLLRAAFQEHVYGVLPEPGETTVVASEVIDADAYDGRARIEQVTLGVRVGGEDARFNLVLATPNAGAGPHPVILTQHFCGNRVALGGNEAIAGPLSDYPGACDNALAGPLITAVFGRYISGPPVADIIERGYALGVFYPGDVVPDAPQAGLAALERLSGSDRGDQRWGAIAAWGWLYSRAVDHLETDARFDRDRMAVWGHSRNGKSALVAAAFDTRIDLVIAHQSGTGGATLSRSYAGESVAKITEEFPHWFAQAYAGYAGGEESLPVDQHQLLALIAPRPVLLGNARRDQWSDPHGAFRAAQGADAVYELFGSSGLDQNSMADVNLSADLTFFLRPGRHGVTAADWEMFLEFLDAHFGGGA